MTFEERLAIAQANTQVEDLIAYNRGIPARGDMSQRFENGLSLSAVISYKAIVKIKEVCADRPAAFQLDVVSTYSHFLAEAGVEDTILPALATYDNDVDAFVAATVEFVVLREEAKLEEAMAYANQ